MSSKRTGITCRCPICHRNDAGSNRQRKSYVVLGIRQDENGLSKGDKRRAHKERRRLEKTLWQKDFEQEKETIEEENWYHKLIQYQMELNY